MSLQNERVTGSFLVKWYGHEIVEYHGKIASRFFESNRYDKDKNE